MRRKGNSIRLYGISNQTYLKRASHIASLLLREASPTLLIGPVKCVVIIEEELMEEEVEG